MKRGSLTSGRECIVLSNDAPGVRECTRALDTMQGSQIERPTGNSQTAASQRQIVYKALPDDLKNVILASPVVQEIRAQAAIALRGGCV
jgi:hypothetical protein